jgi:hypothetical protein
MQRRIPKKKEGVEGRIEAKEVTLPRGVPERQP